MFITAFALALAVVAAQPPDLPEKFWSKNPYRAAPTWISARTALDHGILRSGVLADYEASELHRHVQQAQGRRSAAETTPASNPCDVTFGALFDDVYMPGVSTFEDVRRYAETHQVLEGIVVASEVGLYSGTPFTVVQVRVTHASQPNNLNTAYLLVPKGSLSVDGVALCTSDPRYAGVPENGDSILFLAGESVDSDGTLFRIPAEHIFVSHDNAIVLAPRLRRSRLPARSLKELRQLLEHPTPAVR